MSPCNRSRQQETSKQELEPRLRQVAELAQKYLSVLLRRKQPDPLAEAILRQHSEDLKAIHLAALHYLPSPKTPMFRESGVEDRQNRQHENVNERRSGHGH